MNAAASIAASAAGTSSRASLIARLVDARARTDAVLALVPDAKLFECPIALRHPFAFYIGHLEAFDANLLGERIGVRAGGDLDRLFAFGIDPLEARSGEAPAWPSLAAIRDYARTTRAAVSARLPDALDAGDAALTTRVEVAIEHRLMHAETLAYMLNQASCVRSVRASAPAATPYDAGAMSEIPAGRATLGVERERAGFAWDNEHDAHAVDVAAFEIARHMTSNGEFLAFVEAGGYDDASLWSTDDWAWRTSENITHPAFWTRLGGVWHQRSLFELVPLPRDWPVHVSHAEASAFARWKSMRLPSEAEWHRAAYGTASGDERRYPWGDDLAGGDGANVDLRYGEPRGVATRQGDDSAFGVRGLVGNGWEWTRTPFAPFAGFRPQPGYEGYSRDFFDDRHFVLKGGSGLTATALLRRSFRNWFQPHYPYVHAGFRCVRD